MLLNKLLEPLKIKFKIYKYMISTSKNMSIYRLTDINNQYNNIYHSAINM